MGLVVNIYYTGKNGSAKKFAEEMVKSGIVDRVRAEDDNERYEYFFPMDDTETVMLIDKLVIDKKHRLMAGSITSSFGEPGGTRTHDTKLKRLVL